jgi:hypothetical protein
MPDHCAIRTVVKRMLKGKRGRQQGVMGMKSRKKCDSYLVRRKQNLQLGKCDLLFVFLIRMTVYLHKYTQIRNVHM